ncbi:molybdopterin-binding protein [Salmonella enterica subsp. enterica serovar Enteritidis]|nr:molybdopterin-binding protein [Salmonella enterica subsp. enterica serovar Enteritidis]
MKTELNVANSLVLNRLAGRSKNNYEIVPGFNKKTTVLASAISILKQ